MMSRRLRRTCNFSALATMLLALAVSGAAAAARAAESAADVPLVVPRMAAPTLDGSIDPAEWRAAVSVEFVDNSVEAQPIASTRASVGYDDQNLYLAFVCDEPLMPRAVRNVKKPRDADVWDNECIEIFIDPHADRAGYIQLGVDILNQTYDALGSDHWGFNPPWRTATRADDKQWSVEVAIPFASLGAGGAPKPGQKWLANVCRERKVQNELSAWRAAHGSFASPGTFGPWVFGSLNEHLAREAQPLAAANGVADGEWKARLADWQQRLADSKDLDADQYQALATELKVLRSDLRKLRRAAARAAGQRFAVARAWPYQHFTSEPSDAKPGTLDPIELTMLRDEWIDLAFDITNLTDEPLVLRCTTRHGNADDSDYIRLGLPPLATHWQQATPVAAGDGMIVLDALVPNNAGIIHVAPGKTAQAWLSVHCAPDASAEAIAGRIVIQPIDMSGGEPLVVPIRASFVPIKLTDHPPLHCFTWNFAGDIESNPKWWRAHLEDLVAHGVDTCMISSLQHLPRVQAKPDGTMPDTLDFTKLDRLLDTTKGLFRLYWINMDVFEKASVRTDLIGLEFGTPQYERAFKQWLKMVLAHLHARGLSSEQFMINPYDESIDERCQLLARWIKEVDPSVRIVIDSSTPDVGEAKKMDALTDVWVPHYRQFFPAEMQPFQQFLKSTGKPVWAYWYSQGSAEKGQDPLCYYLAKFWWAFANDIDGIGYWAQQYYGDPWFRQDWQKSYDTALWYPNDDGVLPSRRWQAWRQGWQDYLLLSIVRSRLRERNDTSALATLQSHVDAVLKAPDDVAGADAARDWLKSMLTEQSSGDGTAETR